MKKIFWSDRVRNEEELQRIKKDRKANWMGYMIA